MRNLIKDAAAERELKIHVQISEKSQLIMTRLHWIILLVI